MAKKLKVEVPINSKILERAKKWKKSWS
jgi:hypothetical protein